MSWSRRLSLEPADALRAGVPLFVLLGAVALPGPVLPVILAGVLVAGVGIAVARRAPVAWSWGAAVPAALIASVRALEPPSSTWAATVCGATGGPAVVWAVGEALLVVAAAAILTVALKAKAADAGLRLLPRYAIGWAVIGGLAVLALGLAGAVFFVQPVLGGAAVHVDGPAFLLPAVVFAVALAVSEETAWRGILQGWLARLLGPFLAALAQAALYGVAWGVILGSSYAGLLAGAAGLLLGAVVIRTRSLLVVISWHAAFNVALYLVVVCRPG